MTNEKTLVPDRPSELIRRNGAKKGQEKEKHEKHDLQLGLAHTWSRLPVGLLFCRTLQLSNSPRNAGPLLVDSTQSPILWAPQVVDTGASASLVPVWCQLEACLQRPTRIRTRTHATPYGTRHGTRSSTTAQVPDRGGGQHRPTTTTTTTHTTQQQSCFCCVWP